MSIKGQLVSDDYTPKGTDTSTKGRLKIDNCKVTLLYKARKPEETDVSPETPDIDPATVDQPETQD